MKSIVILLALLLAATTLAAAGEKSPHEVVERLHETLLQAMTEAEQLGYDGRYDLISPIVEESFDFNTIARVVTGRYWNDIEWPTLRFYDLPPVWILSLPLAACLFLAMTWTSAIRYWCGERTRWKARSYARKATF